LPDNRSIKLGLIQHACPVGDSEATPQANLAKAVGMIRDAAGRGAELIVTQELFTSAYFPQVEDDARFDLAEPIPGPTTQTLCKLAEELGVAISASLFEKRAPGVYHNTSVMIDRSGQLIGRYRKMHIPDDPRFYEKYYFTPGDSGSASDVPGVPGSTPTDPDSGIQINDQPNNNAGPEPSEGPGTSPQAGFSVQHLPGANVTTGMLICWDQWFPEAARLTALRGAELLLYPTAIGWYHGEPDDEKPRQLDAWQVMQRSHAIANGVFVAAVNRVGTEDDLAFWGRSFVADPRGQIIAEASGDQEEVLIAECDLGLIEVMRRGWPFLRDRRIDAYSGLLKRMLDD